MFYGDFRTMKRFLCHTSIYIKLNAKNDLSVPINKMFTGRSKASYLHYDNFFLFSVLLP